MEETLLGKRKNKPELEDPDRDEENNNPPIFLDRGDWSNASNIKRRMQEFRDLDCDMNIFTFEHSGSTNQICIDPYKSGNNVLCLSLTGINKLLLKPTELYELNLQSGLKNCLVDIYDFEILSEIAGFITNSMGVIYILGKLRESSNWSVFQLNRKSEAKSRLLHLHKVPILVAPLKPCFYNKENANVMRVFDYKLLKVFDVSLQNSGSLALLVHYTMPNHALIRHLETCVDENILNVRSFRPTIDGKGALIVPMPIIDLELYSNNPRNLPVCSARLGLDTCFSDETGSKRKITDGSESKCAIYAKWPFQPPVVAKADQSDSSDFRKTSFLTRGKKYHLSIRNACLDFHFDEPKDLRFVGLECELRLFSDNFEDDLVVRGLFVFAFLIEGTNICVVQSASFNSPEVKNIITWPFTPLHVESNVTRLTDLCFDGDNLRLYVNYESRLKSYEIPKSWTKEFAEIKPSPVSVKLQSAEKPSDKIMKHKTVQPMLPKSSLTLVSKSDFSSSSKPVQPVSRVVTSNCQVSDLEMKIAKLESEKLMLQKELNLANSKINFYEGCSMTFSMPKLVLNERNELVCATSNVAPVVTNALIPSKSEPKSINSEFDITVRAPVMEN